MYSITFLSDIHMCYINVYATDTRQNYKTYTQLSRESD